MNKILYILCLLIVCSFTSMKAQSNTYLTYGVGFATGDLGEFISQPSFRGATLDYYKMVQPNVGVGFSLGWNVFYEEKDYDTYVFETQTLSGKQFHYSNHVPMLLGANYYLHPGEKVDPFIGANLGVMYTRRNTDMNLYTVEQEAWNFTIQPQVGVQFNNSLSSAMTIMLKYYMGLAAGDLPETQSFLSLNVGFVFRQP